MSEYYNGTPTINSLNINFQSSIKTTAFIGAFCGLMASYYYDFIAPMLVFDAIDRLTDDESLPVDSLFKSDGEMQCELWLVIFPLVVYIISQNLFGYASISLNRNIILRICSCVTLIGITLTAICWDLDVDSKTKICILSLGLTLISIGVSSEYPLGTDEIIVHYSVKHRSRVLAVLYFLRSICAAIPIVYLDTVDTRGIRILSNSVRLPLILMGVAPIIISLIVRSIIYFRRKKIMMIQQQHQNVNPVGSCQVLTSSSTACLSWSKIIALAAISLSSAFASLGAGGDLRQLANSTAELPKNEISRGGVPFFFIICFFLFGSIIAAAPARRSGALRAGTGPGAIIAPVVLIAYWVGLIPTLGLNSEREKVWLVVCNGVLHMMFVAPSLFSIPPETVPFTRRPMASSITASSARLGSYLGSLMVGGGDYNVTLMTTLIILSLGSLIAFVTSSVFLKTATAHDSIFDENCVFSEQEREQQQLLLNQQVMSIPDQKFSLPLLVTNPPDSAKNSNMNTVNNNDRSCIPEETDRRSNTGP